MKVGASAASSRTGVRSRSLCAAALVFAFIAVAGVPGVSRAEADLRLVGTFARPDGGLGIRANGEMLIDPKARRAYQAVTAIGTTITEFDLDSLKPLRKVTLPEFQPAFTTSGETQFLWVLDEQNHRIFTVVRGNDSRGQRNYSIAVVDLARMKFALTDPMWPLPDRFPLAISYHEPTERLYVLAKVNADVFGREMPFIEERSVDGGVSWSHLLPMCSAARDHLLAPVIARSTHQDRIYLDCYSRNTVQAQVVRVQLGEDGRPADEDVFPAVPKAVSAIFDPGSDRIIFLTSNGNAGRGAWVFDGPRGNFLGVIASGDTTAGANDYAMGLDPRRGRLYVQTPAGLIVADARSTPLGAGLLFPEYAGAGYVPIHVDSVTKRVFAPDPTTATATGQPDRFRVLLDEAPDALGVRALDPDVLTAGVEEAPGVTGVNYSGAASAFAARTLTTGGFQRAAWNATMPSIDPDNLQSAWRALQGLPASSADRDLIAARVTGISLDNDSADARASAATASEANLKDLRDRDIDWPYRQAECHGTGAERAAAEEEGTTVVCDARPAHARTAAETTAERFGVPIGGVSFGAEKLSARSEVLRSSPRGTVARSLAVVRNLTIGDRVRIGELRARAETWARGLKGTAGSLYERELLDVWIDSDGDGDADLSCKVCDAAAVLTHINRALAGTAVARMPKPDGAFYPQGSPGGYQAVVRRDIFESLSASSLNADDAPEVPGLEITVYNDGRAGRSRQIFQFAAVEAESRYGIYLLPSKDTGSADVGPSQQVVRREVVDAPATSDVKAPREPQTPKEIVTEVLRRVRDGMRLVLTSPREALMLAALWVFLAAPLSMIKRRKALEQVGR